jgi:hypothetical protein
MIVGKLAITPEAERDDLYEGPIGHCYECAGQASLAVTLENYDSYQAWELCKSCARQLAFKLLKACDLP